MVVLFCIRGGCSLNNLVLGTIAGTAAGIAGTGLGGAFAFLLRQPGRRLLSTILSLSAGLMMAVVCFDLLPRSFELSGLGIGLLGTVIGAAVIAMIQELLSLKQNPGRRQKNYARTGLLIGIGIALHNFPEGLAIGVGFTSFQTFGAGLSLIIALHDVPEGIVMATPMRMGGIHPIKIVFAALLAGVPTGIGALTGYLLGEISPYFIGLCLGFAGGAMLYITCSELIPESRDLYRGRISGIGLVLGMLLGMAMSELI
ncbi:MAG TPA: ZIP family metal transporter [Clostridiales bacterium]|nr:ZIP family metal transporter [Clostridiales bacterium]